MMMMMTRKSTPPNDNISWASPGTLHHVLCFNFCTIRAYPVCQNDLLSNIFPIKQLSILVVEFVFQSILKMESSILFQNHPT